MMDRVSCAGRVQRGSERVERRGRRAGGEEKETVQWKASSLGSSFALGTWEFYALRQTRIAPSRASLGL